MAGLRTQSFAGMLAGVKNAVLGVFESWGIETLDDGGETSASNESSVVLYGRLDHKKVLLASDAGQIPEPPAIYLLIAYLVSGVLWLALVTASSVRDAADEYARQLLTSLEVL